MANVIRIFVGASKDLFGAYSDNCPGIYAEGDSFEECKKEVYNAIELIKAELPEEQWPEPLRSEYSIEWFFDKESIITHYSGVSQQQLWEYMHGHIPSPDNAKRIRNAIQKFAADAACAQFS